jgi:hypothetical protein
LQGQVLVLVFKFSERKMEKMSEDAKKKWELENRIESIDGDKLYKYDQAKYNSYLSTKPWTKE